ncbi:response regulator transcription factor [Piscinibacter gummiphilus]|uniref:Response regulator receiver protein n=1 Tax=Piscinibacter gummiphilus TaxID=946333 RepID=A0A1W6L3H1_9BURK|nr:response regulator [Piscinibacter gummiphilus]ARN18706.1 response regulator receiver protein [Piscinibacter gummiphilus]ATU63344.1 response regulator [Piscinibacter gummiphilus]GLS95854.1 response regulator [Piscinibacter gummiphilus]
MTTGSTVRALVTIVDDDPFVRTATSSLVRSFGWDARTFPSALDFLAADVAPLADCLVCDIGMEQLDGIGLLARLQENGQQVPTVFITALASEGVRQRALRQGALCVIEKPIDAAELEDWVRRALSAAARG